MPLLSAAAVWTPHRAWSESPKRAALTVMEWLRARDGQGRDGSGAWSPEKPTRSSSKPECSGAGCWTCRGRRARTRERAGRKQPLGLPEAPSKLLEIRQSGRRRCGLERRRIGSEEGGLCWWGILRREGISG
ncbi:hypothetical protein BRADI_4g41671v3 [Brachypodium distachyon]|uniref:Uncharacterized protein n=1 Tax=Brachypodium distachyon TaxID=15368 RepID=A0A2K2CTN7_BRADI|nr:hypothetical protein BRADI_4g41671v3 [Brachypodium distachyon]